MSETTPASRMRGLNKMTEELNVAFHSLGYLYNDHDDDEDNVYKKAESALGRFTYLTGKVAYSVAVNAEALGVKPPPLAILNTSIATEDGAYSLRTVSAAEARSIIKDREILSAVGHESAAAALSEVLGVEVPVNRIQFAQQPGQIALVFNLRGRLPEGQVLSLAEIEALGYDLKILERLS